MPEEASEARVACDCRSSDRLGRSELCKHRKDYKQMSNLSNPFFYYKLLSLGGFIATVEIAKA